MRARFEQAQVAAPTVGLTVRSMEVRDTRELDVAFEAIIREHPEALLDTCRSVYQKSASHASSSSLLNSDFRRSTNRANLSMSVASSPTDQTFQTSFAARPPTSTKFSGVQSRQIFPSSSQLSSSWYQHESCESTRYQVPRRDPPARRQSHRMNVVTGPALPISVTAKSRLPEWDSECEKKARTKKPSALERTRRQGRAARPGATSVSQALPE